MEDLVFKNVHVCFGAFLPKSAKLRAVFMQIDSFSTHKYDIAERNRDLCAN